MKQMETQRWKDTCLQLEKQLKELQATLSPSQSRVHTYVCISFLLNHECIHCTIYLQHCDVLILLCVYFYSGFSGGKTVCC